MLIGLQDVTPMRPRLSIPVPQVPQTLDTWSALCRGSGTRSVQPGVLGMEFVLGRRVSSISISASCEHPPSQPLVWKPNKVFAPPTKN